MDIDLKHFIGAAESSERANVDIVATSMHYEQLHEPLHNL